MSVNYPCRHGVTRYCRVCEDAPPSKAESSFAATHGSVVTWAVIYRAKAPFAAFNNKRMAEGYRAEAPHRQSDTIALRKISFAGSMGYPLNGELSDRASKT